MGKMIDLAAMSAGSWISPLSERHFPMGTGRLASSVHEPEPADSDAGQPVRDGGCQGAKTLAGTAPESDSRFTVRVAVTAFRTIHTYRGRLTKESRRTAAIPASRPSMSRTFPVRPSTAIRLAGIYPLEDYFAAKGTRAPVVLEQADKEPLLVVVRAWVDEVGQEPAVALGGLLSLRDALRTDLADPPPD